MTRRESAEPFVLSPLTLDWTIGELLAWIGAEDARCHEEGLADAVHAVNRALGETAVTSVTPVVAVRSLAMRVASEPALGTSRVVDVLAQIPVPDLACVERGVMTPA
ncbi:hypothetical protein QE418_002802 [Microbacterium testaceum]|uniref:hypothetical protein n=1 Tax=Microbacterium TaxID=33882 RepID=UPI00278ABE0D|nr:MULTISPECIES: hypothetical protein [Microbacterium]MDQ1113354.1 hypothetical protein [Microbacterium testaceum]MDR6099545.1 hypothetical protein [Microbacterium sp. SORGH_AS_0454]